MNGVGDCKKGIIPSSPSRSCLDLRRHRIIATTDMMMKMTIAVITKMTNVVVGRVKLSMGGVRPVTCEGSVLSLSCEEVMLSNKRN